MLERSIVVPAFNEATRLPSLLRQLPDFIDPKATELIVVDDGSIDGTASVATAEGQWAASLQVIEFSTNQGKGAAVRAGVAASTTERVTFLDADNATDLTAIADLEAALDHAHAAFGSRNTPGAVVAGSPALRGFMGRSFSRVARTVLGTKVSDSQCGAKTFRGEIARPLFGAAQLDGFAFDIEILRMLELLDLRVVEVPVRWTHQPGSKISLIDPFKMFADTIAVRLRTRLEDLPAHLTALAQGDTQGDNWDQ